MNPRTIYVDGALYFLMAAVAAHLGYISTEESYKYIDSTVLYWMKGADTFLLAGFNSLKGFRSMTFGRHVQMELDKQNKKAPGE